MEKFNKLMIGTIAVCVLLLPGVISTFTGSHEYIAPEEVNCIKCHADILAELEACTDNHTHSNSAWTEKQVFDCLECHVVGDIGAGSSEGHAARKVDCAICHNSSLWTGNEYRDYMHALNIEYGMDEGTGYCGSCHDMTQADHMFLDNVYDTITDPNAPHYPFYTNSMDSSTLLGATEACVGCHSHVEFTIEGSLGGNMTYNPDSGEISRE